MAYWVFDYDNTLYHPSSGVLDKIDVRIEEYISNTLSISTDDANHLREKYYKKYGTTIQGLMEHHSIKPNEYFDYIMNDETVPPDNSEIKSIIDALPGQKSIFSNGIRKHINRGLKILNLENTFDHIFEIEDFNYISKPFVAPYKFVEEKLRRTDIIFIDDSFDNIVTAHSIGWTAILIDRDNTKRDIPEGIIVIKELDELIKLELV